MNSQSAILNTFMNSDSFLPLLQKFYSLEAIAKERWSDDVALYVGLNKNQMLFENGNGAETLATVLFLEELRLKFNIKFVKNVNEMSPSGKGPLLKCGKYSVGEYEPITNFCSLKNYSLSSLADISKRNQVKSYLLMISNIFSNVLNLFLWTETENRQVIYDTFREMYPFPLNLILYASEYLFIRNKLECNKVWNSSKSDLLRNLCEVLESLNRKLEGSLYLLENKLSDADLLLYSYLKVISTFKQFAPINESINQYTNLNCFFANLDDKYSKILKEKLNFY